MSVPTPFPSPVPPWHRPVQSPDTQTINESLVEDGISLNNDVTYLDSIVPFDSTNEALAYEVTLPDGNYKRQIKRIFIPNANYGTTAAFEVVGTIVGATKLRFDKETGGTSVVLEWDGSAWHLIGGNAALI